MCFVYTIPVIHTLPTVPVARPNQIWAAHIARYYFFAITQVDQPELEHIVGRIMTRYIYHPNYF